MLRTVRTATTNRIVPCVVATPPSTPGVTSPAATATITATATASVVGVARASRAYVAVAQRSVASVRSGSSRGGYNATATTTSRVAARVAVSSTLLPTLGHTPHALRHSSSCGGGVQQTMRTGQASVRGYVFGWSRLSGRSTLTHKAPSSSWLSCYTPAHTNYSYSSANASTSTSDSGKWSGSRMISSVGRGGGGGNFYQRQVRLSSSKAGDGNEDADAPSGTTDSNTQPPLDPSTLPLILQVAPESLVPYIRLARADRPIGTWLLLYPCLWSAALAAPEYTSSILPPLSVVAGLSTGAVIMRGFGCTVNDMWDSDFDAKVARTADRPLASGQVSTPQAFAFLSVQLAAAFGAASVLDYHAIAMATSSLGLVVIYPLMKRVTYWPQAVLGLTFNWGAFVGYAATSGTVDVGPMVPLYFGGLAWTLFYDTIYAHQDKADDVAVGVKSSALALGARTKPALAGFAAVAAACFAATGYLVDASWPYYAGVGSASAHMAWQLASVDLDDPESCRRTFLSNTKLGMLLLGGILASNYVGGAAESVLPAQALGSYWWTYLSGGA